METNIDRALWHIAKKRAVFKQSLTAYLLVNSFLWIIYFLNLKRNTYPWPLWVMLGWGIGLAFLYIDAYYSNSLFSAENEYDKLKKTTEK